MSVLLGDAAAPASWQCSVRRTASGMARSSLDHAHALQAGQVPHPAEVQGQHGQHGDLVGERLGAGDADFRAGVQIDAAVGLAGDAAADHVAQRQRRMPLALRFAQGGQGVGRLAGLRDGQDDGVAVDRRIAIAELARRIRPRPGCGRTPRTDIRRPGPRASWCRRPSG